MCTTESVSKQLNYFQIPVMEFNQGHFWSTVRKNSFEVLESFLANLHFHLYLFDDFSYELLCCSLHSAQELK